MEETKIALFEQKQVRRVWYQDGWYFSVIDIIGVLTDSTIPKRYWSDLKIKLRQEGSEVYEKIVQLKFLANDGKYYLSDAANIETMFRIIQSIPSPKAEPFKIWLAQVGRERLDEIQNPELAQDRARKYYELKGYPKSWIEKRLRGIAIRQELTNEWKNRGIKEQTEYAILTNEIAQATFDVSVNQHKKLKGLDVKNANQNLRDHMTDLELIFSMLGEKVTTEITKKDDAQGFMPCQNAAKRGGRVARNARLETEKEIGRKVVSKENYLSLSKKKRLKK
ncbi:MAG: phage antirepressor protein [Bdellovibrionales bacterium RIFOXYB2_FULL_36_6]|nr:MAG: phage antirepressor protein [Bdellovibrionales bacterium RIFOXYB2_FULL_36_6]